MEVFAIEELINQSIMSKIPVLIVEGIDDVPLYDSIIKGQSLNFDIIAIENVEGFSPGSKDVILALDSILNLPLPMDELKKNILGIIDKDVRDYRGELPTNELIFTLQAYSIESHFVNQEVALEILSSITKTTAELRNQSLVNLLENTLSRDLKILYLYSLDALKGSVDSSYISSSPYSAKLGNILNNAAIAAQIELKKLTLVQFGLDLNLTDNIIDLRKFVKGKWLFEQFCKILNNSVDELPEKCKSGEITTCQFCRVSDSNKCLYKKREGINDKTIQLLGIQQTENEELNYIKTKLREIFEIRQAS